MQESVREALERGARGDLDAVEEALHALAGDASVSGDAHRAALRAQLWFATERHGEEDAPASWGVERALGAEPEVRSVAMLAGAQLVRARALAFDGPGLETAVDLMRELAAGLPIGEATGWRDVAIGWLDVARGRPLSVDLDAVGSVGRTVASAELVLESMTVRALGAVVAGDLDLARAQSRLASRMARTESIPQLEYLASLVLARVRRLTGQPHLSARIISALLRVATRPFRPWLAWELLLAQGHAPDIDLGGTPPMALARALGAARAGDRSAFDAAARDLRGAARGFAPLEADATHLLPSIDPGASLDDAPPGVVEFCRGEGDAAPRGLAGVCGTDEPGAWVLAPRARPARRVLSPGLGLARVLVDGADADAADGRQLRTESTIAVLALAGRDGMDEGDLFRRLYGFEYEASRHQAVRGVLYNRVRKRLGDCAELVRDGGTVSLACREDLLAPDPRCTPPAELRILHVLAERRRAAPKDVAVALGIPLRTAQDALRRLMEDGALRSERAARGLQYILEDTTFSEPTRQVRR